MATQTQTTTSAILLIAVLGSLTLPGVCGAMAGVGSDISKGGKAIENSANKHAPG